MDRLPRCLHCGSMLPIHRNRFCSEDCEFEDKADRKPSLQRITSFQALVDAATWLRINNISLDSLSKPNRKVVLVEKTYFRQDGFKFSSYRLTPAGYRLLARWKSQLQVSV